VGAGEKDAVAGEACFVVFGWWILSFFFLPKRQYTEYIESKKNINRKNRPPSVRTGWADGVAVMGWGGWERGVGVGKKSRLFWWRGGGKGLGGRH